MLKSLTTILVLLKLCSAIRCLEGSGADFKEVERSGDYVCTRTIKKCSSKVGCLFSGLNFGSEWRSDALKTSKSGDPVSLDGTYIDEYLVCDTSLCNASGSKANNLAPRPRQTGCFYGRATPFQKYFHSKVGDDVYCVRTRVSCEKETCLLGNGWNYLAMTKTDLEKRLKIYRDNPDLLAMSFEEFHYCLGDFCNAPTESSETSFSKNDKNSNGIIRGPDLNSNRLSRGTVGIENINFNGNTGLNRLLSGGEEKRILSKAVCLILAFIFLL